MQTMIVRLKSRSGGETEFARRLRLGVPAVMARIQEGWLILDLRTIFPNQEESLLEAVAACS
jgi:L-seryl-tRNA(Ser) seleniumtransferase